MLILKITCGSTLLCELYVVGSDETAQVCAVKYTCEYEQCWNVKIQFTAGKRVSFEVISLVCGHTVRLPLQSAMSLSNQKGFVFSFLRMNYLLLGETVPRGSQVTLTCQLLLHI